MRRVSRRSGLTDPGATRGRSRSNRAARLGIPPGDLWIFGYGSLMWDPGFPYIQWAPAIVHGYHRALCVLSHRWRGTPERPGLVLGLIRGGACRGIAFRVARADVEATLQRLWAREMRRRVYHPRLLRVRLPGREVRALGFVADTTHPAYAGELTIQQIAERIVNSSGARGPNLDYLTRTIEHLAELGVRDRNLMRVLAATRALRPPRGSPQARATALPAPAQSQHPTERRWSARNRSRSLPGGAVRRGR